MRDMAKINPIDILDDITDLDTKKLIMKVLKDESLSNKEKEEVIKEILLSYSDDLDSSQDSSDESMSDSMDLSDDNHRYSSTLVFDKIANTSFFVNSDKEVLEYLISKKRNLEDVVVYKKQKGKITFENSN